MSIDAVALLDANVLYPAPMRDLLLQLAVAGLFRAKWTDDIHREWIEALLRNEPRRARSTLDRTRELMNRAVRDCLIVGYAPLIPTLTLPDPDDRHVLGAAIAGDCEVIITHNLSHFPATVLTPFGITAQHPDAFLAALFLADPGGFCAAVRRLRARLQHPSYGVDEYLAILERQGLAQTVQLLRPLSGQV